MTHITIERQKLKLALEALEDAAYCVQKNYCPDKIGHDWDDTITAIKQALAQPEQEPSLQEQLDKANADWDKALEDRNKANAVWNKAYADRNKADADREKADADRTKAYADWDKAYEEVLRIKSLMEQQNG